MSDNTQEASWRSMVWSGLLALALVVVLATPSGASSHGSVSGTITIPSGSVAVSACVLVTNFDDVFLEECTADGETAYLVDNVPAGKYSVQFYTNTPDTAFQWYNNVVDLESSTDVWVESGENVVLHANLALSGEITGTISHSHGATIESGCVEVYTLSGNYVMERCPSTENYVLDSLAAGQYKVRFYDFDNSAYLYYPASNTFEGASPVTVVAGGTTVANVTLTPPGTITGTVTKNSGSGNYNDAWAVLLTIDDAYYVDYSAVVSDGTYIFSGLPAGEYNVLIGGVPGYGLRWYRSNESSLRPTAVSIPGPGDSWTRSGINQQLTLNTSSLQGFLNVPKVQVDGNNKTPWNSASFCAHGTNSSNPSFGATVLNRTPLSSYCGSRGSFYLIDRLPLGGPTFMVFSNGYVVDGAGVIPSNSTFVPFGSAGSRSVGQAFNLPSGSSYYLPYFYFTDIGTSVSGYENVYWMGDVGISEGYADGSYKPDNRVIRKHMALFMYRLMGQPEFTLPPTSPFKDVKVTEAGYNAMAWMAEEGISVGYADGTYKPNNFVTRKHMALFMYRLAGEPDFTMPTHSPFTDVSTTDSGYEAMAWMAVTGISEGYHDGTFKPNNLVTRKHMSFFMKRFVDNVLEDD